MAWLLMAESRRALPWVASLMPSLEASLLSVSSVQMHAVLHTQLCRNPQFVSSKLSWPHGAGRDDSIP